MKKSVAAKPEFRPSGYVLAGRFGYAILASAFALCVVIQVFFAGVGAFGADWSLHTSFIQLFGWLPLLMVFTAFVGRSPLILKAAPVGLLVMIGVQFALAGMGSFIMVAALHPVNGLAIFVVAALVARSAWRSALDARKNHAKNKG